MGDVAKADAAKAAARAASDEKACREQVEANYRASLKVSPEAPTRFSSELQQQVYSSYKQFSVGQFCESAPALQFLATVAVLSCISIFAWTKKGRDGRPKGFGAHVNGMAIHCGIRQQVWWGEKQRHSLQELVDALKKAFAGVNAGDVEVHLVGGHKYSDRDDKFKSAKPGSRPLMSWHVLDAVRKAGFTKINQTMLNPFPGGPLGPSPLCELRLCQENQRFAVVALHLKSGLIVTHSDAKSADDEVPKEMWAASDRMVATIPFNGKPLQHTAVELVKAAVPWYTLAVGGLLLWWMTNLYHSLGCVAVLFFVLQPPSIVHEAVYIVVAALLFKSAQYLNLII